MYEENENYMETWWKRSLLPALFVEKKQAYESHLLPDLSQGALTEQREEKLIFMAINKKIQSVVFVGDVMGVVNGSVSVDLSRGYVSTGADLNTI